MKLDRVALLVKAPKHDIVTNQIVYSAHHTITSQLPDLAVSDADFNLGIIVRPVPAVKSLFLKRFNISTVSSFVEIES